MKKIVGYSLWCKNCGGFLKEENYLLKRLNPINFDYLIKKCPACNEKYHNKCDEFFTISRKDFYCKLFSSIITWTLWVLFASLIIGIFQIESDLFYSLFFMIYIIATILYSFSFKNRWDKAIIKSKKRLNELEYLLDLYIFNILTLDNIKEYYSNRIISKSVFEDFSNTINEIRNNINTSQSIITDLMNRSNLSQELCIDVYNILTEFKNSNKDDAYSLIENKLIPDLKSNNSTGDVGIAFGMLIDECALSESEAQGYSSMVIYQMTSSNSNINKYDNISWNDYLENNFKAFGTKTTLKDLNMK